MSTYTLHLIASRPSHGERHVDPVDPRALGRYCSRDEALTAGYSYLENHPGAWLQIEGPYGRSEDVKPGGMSAIERVVWCRAYFTLLGTGLGWGGTGGCPRWAEGQADNTLETLRRRGMVLAAADVLKPGVSDT